MLKLEQICHRFDATPVLENVSFTLLPGQRLALMGPSGSGKTTLTRIALGLLTPDRGTVVNTFSKTAVVFQEDRLLPWRTAVENVNLVLGDRKETLPLAHAQLEEMGLGAAADKYPPQLSGGMRQRVAVARALALDAQLLILDEPFKALDEELRQQVISRVNDTDAAILLVTHDRREAEALGCEIRHLTFSQSS